MSSDAEDELASPERDDLSPDPDGDIQDTADETMADSELSKAGASNDAPNGQSKAQKDIQKPRRKKARRACHACQRAHLTCGDERPCARCIKRGLQSQCADGVRKKAKYLHDAPPEALIPPSMGGTYTLNGSRAGVAPPAIAASKALPQPNYFAAAQPPTLQIFPPAPNQQMQPQIQSATASFGGQTPMSPQFNTTPQLPSSQPGPTTPNMQYPFDPSDPAFFNFDLASFNFGNQYGALEFGMLHHMSGAHDTGGPDVINPMNQVPNPYGINYADGNALLFSHDAMMNVDFNSQRGSQSLPVATPNNTPIIQSVDRTDIANGPYAIAIGDRPSSLTSGSPVSITHDVKPAMEGPSSPAVIVPQLTHANNQHPVQHPHKHVEPVAATSPLNPSRKRPHDADWIYETVKKPYSYTSGFHRLLTYIKLHFTKNNLSRITQSIAVIRPALLTFAQRLTERDLIFMEVSVQRTLFEYDDFIKATGTPTIVMRRDGTILTVSTEFTLMTGWSKAVLLGKKPNRNVNRASGSTAPTADATKPRGDDARPSQSQQQQVNGSAGHQGVLIAEILDQETVVEFYEDYARLAFGDPAGRAVRRGRLLKYRDPQQPDGLLGQHTVPTSASPSAGSAVAAVAIAEGRGEGHGEVKPPGVVGGGEFVAGENAFNKLGESEGVVDCMYCWLVRRDNFEVPQLIVMNFLPVIPLS